MGLVGPEARMLTIVVCCPPSPQLEHSWAALASSNEDELFLSFSLSFLSRTFLYQESVLKQAPRGGPSLCDGKVES